MGHPDMASYNPMQRFILSTMIFKVGRLILFSHPSPALAIVFDSNDKKVHPVCREWAIIKVL